jgi:acyl-CoA thioester hydrolase
MAHRYVHRDLVQFSDTDMAGIVHFSNFFRFMERAEHAFFRSLGLSIVERSPGGIEGNPMGWPRVHASADFFSPLHFEDEVEVELLIEEVRTRVIRYVFRVRKLDGTLAAEGRITAVCVQKDRKGGAMKAVEIPARIRSLIEAAPAEMLLRPA